LFYDRIRNSILDYKMLTDRLWADAMNLIRNRLKIKNFSCYSLRKTFGRQVYNMNSESSELVLVKLMEMFNYSSVVITKKYLELRLEEILQTYESLSF
jgi:hypothetical protein